MLDRKVLLALYPEDPSTDQHKFGTKLPGTLLERDDPIWGHRARY